MKGYRTDGGHFKVVAAYGERGQIRDSPKLLVEKIVRLLDVDDLGA